MISFKPRKYFIIDPQHVLAGEVMTHASHPDDIVLTEIDTGIRIVLKQGLQIIRYLKNLTEEHDFELAFNSRLTEVEQFELLNCLDQACRNQGLIEFPKVTAMTVKDTRVFKNVDIKTSVIIKNRDHGIWITGYDLDSYGDDCADERLNALSELLEIKELERQKSIVISNKSSIAKINEKKGWRTYSSSSLSIKDILKEVLESLESQENQEKRKIVLDPDTLGTASRKFNSNESEGILSSLEKEENIKDARNEKGNSLPVWQRPIVRRDHNFRNTGKKRPAGSSVSSGIFEEIPTQKEWLGKADIHLDKKERAEAFACKERIASDIYAYYGANTPRIELSKQRVTNAIPELENIELVHTMSELIPGFKTYQDFCGKQFIPTAPNPKQQIKSADGSEIFPERGLGQILAVAVLINDIDVIGGSGGNIGFRVLEDADGSKYAKTIKIDPGEAFYTERNLSSEKERAIRVRTSGEKERLWLHYDNLPLGTKQEFLMTVHKILRTTQATFRGFFARPGAHHFTAYFNSTVGDLTNFLVERQGKLKTEYGSDIELLISDNPALFAGEESLGGFEDVFSQDKAREEEIMAVQEELYYYVDPNVVCSGKFVSLSAKIDEFIDFANENSSNAVFLLKGDSGSGKSLSLRVLEQHLLNKKRDVEQAPMPVYIDLKQFNKANVSRSFQETLQKQYSNEFDPKKTRLVLLMDGYDEIAGGCQQNLYDTQRLKQYAQNIRVIITCRTQYLSTGYQQWFKPAEGTLKEFEIQPFSSQLINQYLQRYSEESIKVHKRSYTLEEYQEKIASLQNLKELITNPFILRLVAESLPQLEDYLKSAGNKKKQNGSEGREEEKENFAQSEKIVLNRYAIYKCFMDHWFVKQERKLIDSKILPPGRQVIKDFLDFSRSIALRLHSKKEIYIKVQEDSVFRNCFDNANPEMAIARSGCPLKRLNDYQYSFIHKAFQEYFIANGILEMISGGSSRLFQSIELSPELIVQDQGVVTFLQDAYAIDPKIEGECLARIDDSRTNTSETEIKLLEERNPAATAANAITFLAAMNYNFGGLDLSGIRIPNAILSHGTFEGTNFTEADLRDVNFSGAWLKNVNFEKANLKGVNFGEWPYLQFKDAITCISFSSDGEIIAAATGSSTIIFEREIKSGRIRELRILNDKFGKKIEYCKFNANGKHLIAHNEDSIAYLYDIKTGDCLLEFKNELKYRDISFDFSSDGKQLVFSKDDVSLCIWNIETGMLTHEFRGHAGKITCCKFSPDGTQIVSGSEDKTIRIWDVAGGVSAHKLAQKDATQTGLNLSGANIEDAVELSDINFMLMLQRGARGFSDREQKRFIENLNDILGSQDQYSSKLDLSQKSINDESAWGIGKYTSWNNLEHLNLSQNLIGNKGAIGIGANLTWKSLKNLNLVDNQIEDEGAVGLAKNKSWCSLEELDLRNNKTSDEGARALSANRDWKSLVNIYLEHNKLSAVPVYMKTLNEKYSKLLISEKIDNQTQLENERHLSERVQTMHAAFKNELEECKDERKKELHSILSQREMLKLSSKDLCREGFLNEAQNQDLHLLWMPYVRSLDLSRQVITNEIATTLVANLSAIDLDELILAESKVDIMNLACLGKNMRWKNLQTLDLSSNSIGEIGAEHVSSNKTWTNIQTLNLSGNYIGDKGAEYLSVNQTWTHLKTLNLSQNRISDKGVECLGNNHTWTCLQTLDLSSNSIGERGAECLSNNNTWTHLEILNLPKNCIGEKGAKHLSSNNTWTKLQTLDLSGNEIGEIGAEYVSSNKTWTDIRTLNLSWNSIGDKGAEYLSNNNTWTNLQILILFSNSISSNGAEHLSNNNTWKNLQTLDLSSNGIGDKGAEHLSNNQTWASLQTINLSENSIGDKGAKYLSNNQTWTQLQTLNLSKNNIGKKGAEHLGKTQTWTNLQTLELYENYIGDKGAEYLSNNQTWTQLRILNLAENKIGEIGAEYLSTSKCWNNLQILDLNGNEVGEKGAEYLSKNQTWTNLQILNLTENKIGAKGLESLSKNKTWTNLQTLNLAKNNIDEKGAEHLSNNQIWTHLQTLDLSLNSIGDKGAEYLSSTKIWSDLRILNLSRNKIGDKGAEHLSSNQTWTNLQTLNLSKNNIDEKGAEHLSNNKIWTHLQILDLSDNYIGDKGAEWLSFNKTWTRLQMLNLSQIKVGDKGAQYLSNNQTWTNLRTLNLSKNSIGDKGAEYLSNNKVWTNLQTLNLLKNSIGEKGTENLSNNQTWTILQTLYLSQYTIGEKGAEYLSNNKAWTNLQALYLSSKSIGDKGAEYLSSNKTWVHLRTLNLADNQIRDKGAKYLGTNKTWTHLRILSLADNKIRDKGAEYLSNNQTWTNIQTLDLSKNYIGDQGAAYLSFNQTWTHLRTLNLSQNKISEIGAEYLSSNEIWTTLQSLDLSSNKIGDYGAVYLSRNDIWTHLQTLKLSNNSISVKGARHLSNNQTWTNLRTLNLSGNEIGNKASEYLGSNEFWTNLQTFDLTQNKIGWKGAELLSRNQTWTNLQTLKLNGNNIGEKGAEYLSSNKTWTNVRITWK